MASTKQVTAPKTRQRGVVEVLRDLLSQGREGEIISLVEKLVTRNSDLERRLVDLNSRGRKNERVSSDQLVLFLDALDGEGNEVLDQANEKLRAASGVDQKVEDIAERETKEPKRQPPLRKAPPAHLPRVPNPISVPEAERPCPKCGSERKCIGHDDTEVIELVPAQVIVRVDRREKLACTKCEGELVRAPMGDKVVAGGRLGSTLVAELLVDKYSDGLPLHRQKQRYARLGIDLSVSTLADQVTWATDLLRPLWRAAVAEVIAATVMHLDGTSLPVLDRSALGGKRIGTLWGYVGNADTAAYLYTTTGKKQGQLSGELGPEDVLALRQGYTVADASNLFDASFEREELIECGCNMHARRYFIKALDAGDARAALPIAAYKKLYAIEAEIRDLGADAKRAERQARSKPVFDELAAWCEAHQPHEPPSSPMGAAIRYLLNHRVALGRFLDAGIVPMDNGIVERLHVRAALTRKNFLFAGSDAGGERAAIAYTILGCCRLIEINPVEYLADVLPRLTARRRLRELPELLPSRWKAARQPAAPLAVPASAIPS